MSSTNLAQPDDTKHDVEKNASANEKIDHEVYSAENSSLGKHDILYSGLQLVDPALNAKIFIVNNVGGVCP